MTEESNLFIFMSFGINYGNLDLLDALYETYCANPADVPAPWRRYFETVDGKPSVQQHLPAQSVVDMRVPNLIEGYRLYGHLAAKVNPIAVEEEPWPEELELEAYGFEPSDVHKQFPTYGFLDTPTATLEQIEVALKETYCDKIGIEYMDLQSPELERWLQERIEPNHFTVKLSIDQKRMILQQLNKSELLEVFIHTKYVGQKRFSLEGGETLIPMLEAIIERGGQLGVEEVVIGMAHRGRLNVLSNILNKSYSDIFSEFEETYIPQSFEGSGDVKYHKGYFSEVKMEDGHKIQITLAPNPSHLEAVNPVVEGQARAKQVHRGDGDKTHVIPVLVHGDAAVAGQGIIYETLQLYALDGYSTGGTVHLVINNQIGFTTLPKEGRSTRYCTDIARAFGAPVFHVNAEEPESCVFATYLALELRQKFHCDVFIDLNCYRKFGHNESDEPAFTQPLEYQLIRKKKPIREIYRDDLINQGVLERAMAESLEEEFKVSLGEALKKAKEPLETKDKTSLPQAKHLPLFEPVETGVDAQTIRQVADALCMVPEGFVIHRKLQKLLEDRLLMVREDDPKPMDWGMAENLAYGTLLWSDFDVRLSGQDCGRGTFSHRHAVWMDQERERAYCPLQHLKPEQGRCSIVNSPLSEYAVLGFEYGYSLASRKALVLWEAQFGDFSNGAQIMIDQFITSAEQKWGQSAPLTLLLPHGYEGQGPEHSSARIERFLTLCGNDNIFVCNPTTPAQLFHMLRRQVIRPFKKPLIVFTPKGLLRLPECVSSIDDLTHGSFQEILDDPNPPENARRILFCSGRIYYDLAKLREEHQDKTTVLIRVEQLYPLHEERLKEIIGSYKGVQQYVWVQEEPHNMGAWHAISSHIQKLLPQGEVLAFVGRPRSASPAAGSYGKHKKEHQQIVDQLFGKSKPSIFDIAGIKRES